MPCAWSYFKTSALCAWVGLRFAQQMNVAAQHLNSFLQDPCKKIHSSSPWYIVLVDIAVVMQTHDVSSQGWRWVCIRTSERKTTQSVLSSHVTLSSHFSFLSRTDIQQLTSLFTVTLSFLPFFFYSLHLFLAIPSFTSLPVIPFCLPSFFEFHFSFWFIFNPWNYFSLSYFYFHVRPSFLPSFFSLFNCFLWFRFLSFHFYFTFLLFLYIPPLSWVRFLLLFVFTSISFLFLIFPFHFLARVSFFPFHFLFP